MRGRPSRSQSDDAAAAEDGGSTTTTPSARYPRVIADDDASPFERHAGGIGGGGLPAPPPLLRTLFPQDHDPPLTQASKLLNICAGGAAVLATARGLMAALLASPGVGGSGGRGAAFRRGFAITFPIYLPAFLLGAGADHALRQRGGKQRTFEHDLP